MSPTRRNILLAAWIALIIAVVIWAKFFQGQGTLSASSLWEQEIKMGLEAMNERRYDDAENHFNSAIGRAQRFGPSDKRLGMSLLDMAELRKDQTKWAESDDLFRRALAILDPNKNGADAKIAHALTDLATVCVAERKFDDARQFMERSVSMTEKSLGPNSPELAERLQIYAGVLLALNKIPEAANAASRATAIENRGAATAPAAPGLR
jgi:tetratricopeptide (TPR) repeat protein